MQTLGLSSIFLDACHRPYGFGNALRILGTIFKGPAGPGVASFFGGSVFQCCWIVAQGCVCDLFAFPKPFQRFPKVYVCGCVWVRVGWICALTLGLGGRCGCVCVVLKFCGFSLLGDSWESCKAGSETPRHKDAETQSPRPKGIGLLIFKTP